MPTTPPIRAEPLLILIRGIPGSGKSTLARSLAQYYPLLHFEADNYFVSLDGEYNFDPSKLDEAHRLCKEDAVYNLYHDRNVVVSNTFTTLAELDRYTQLGYNTLVLKCVGEYGNVHNVPSNTIARMKQRWEDYEGEIEVSSDWVELLG